MWKNACVVCWDMRMCSNHGRYFPVQVPRQCLFLTGYFGVEIDKDNRCSLSSFFNRLCNFSKRIVQCIHKDTALQVNDCHLFIVTFYINDSFSWNSCWIVQRSYHLCGIFNEIKNRFVIKGMIPKRYNVCTSLQ